MKKCSITKREILFFFIGVITMLVVEIVFDWSDFKRGFCGGMSGTNTEVVK